jgi:hypothetical protein
LTFDEKCSKVILEAGIVLKERRMTTETNRSLQPDCDMPKRRGRPRGAIALDATLRRNSARLAEAFADKALEGDAEALQNFITLTKLAAGRDG